MATGDFLIRRNDAETDAILSSNFTATWDTEVHDEGGTITYSAGLFTVPDDAPYFILYSERFVTDTNYTVIQAELLINGVVIEGGKDHTHITTSYGSYDSMVNGHVILELSANDTVAVRYHRSETKTLTCTRVPDDGGFQILQLPDNNDFGLYSTTADHDIAFAYEQLLFNTLREDSATFSGSGAPLDTIQVQSAGRYVYCFSGDTSITSASPPATGEFRLEVAVSGTRLLNTRGSTYVTNYIPGDDEGALSTTGLLNLDSGDNISLWGSFENHKTNVGRTATVASGFTFQLWKLPGASSEFLGTGQDAEDMQGTANWSWNSSDYIDTDSFTISPSGGEFSAVAVDTPGHFLVLHNAVQDNTPSETVREAVPQNYITVSGVKIPYGSGATLDFGDSATNQDSGKYGITVAAILPNLSADEEISVYTVPIGNTGSIPGTDARLGIISLDFLASTTHVGAGSLTADGTLAGAVTATALAAGSAAASGALSGAALVSKIAAGAMNAAGTLAGAVTAAALATGSVAATGTLSGASLVSKDAAGSVDASGTLSGASLVSKDAAGSIGATGTLVGAVTATALTTGSAAAAGTLAGAITATVLTTGAVSVTGTLAANASLGAPVTGTVSAVGTLAGAGMRIANAAGSVNATGSLSASVTVTLMAAGSTSAAGSLAGETVHALMATGAVTAEGFLDAGVRLPEVASGTLLMTGTLTGGYTYFRGNIGTETTYTKETSTLIPYDSGDNHEPDGGTC